MIRSPRRCGFWWPWNPSISPGRKSRWWWAAARPEPGSRVIGRRWASPGRSRGPAPSACARRCNRGAGPGQSCRCRTSSQGDGSAPQFRGHRVTTFPGLPPFSDLPAKRVQLLRRELLPRLGHGASIDPSSLSAVSSCRHASLPERHSQLVAQGVGGNRLGQVPRARRPFAPPSGPSQDEGGAAKSSPHGGPGTTKPKGKPTASPRRWMLAGISLQVRPAAIPQAIQQSWRLNEGGSVHPRNFIHLHGEITKQSSYVSMACVYSQLA